MFGKIQVVLKCSRCYLSLSIAAISVQFQKFASFLRYNPSYSYTFRLSIKIIERFVLPIFILPLFVSKCFFCLFILFKTYHINIIINVYS